MYIIKKTISVIGPLCSGKTSFIYHLIKRHLPEFIPITMSIEYITNSDRNLIIMDFTGSKRILNSFSYLEEKYDLLIIVINTSTLSYINELNYYQNTIHVNTPSIIIINNLDNTDNTDNTELNNFLDYLENKKLTNFIVNCKTGDGINKVRQWLNNYLNINI